MSDNTRKGGPWYCRWHYQPENRSPGLVQDEFYAACQRPGAIATQLAEWYPPERTTRVDVERQLAEHPEWKRQDGEGATAYRERMSPLCRRLAKGLLQR